MASEEKMDDGFWIRSDDIAVILPCKVCGGIDFEFPKFTVGHNDYAYAVGCRGCHIVGPSDYSTPDAIKAWNMIMSEEGKE